MNVEHLRKVQFKVEWVENPTDTVVFDVEVCKHVEELMAKTRDYDEYQKLVESYPDAIFHGTPIEDVFFDTEKQAMHHLIKYGCIVWERWASHGEIGYPQTVKTKVKHLGNGGTLFLLEGDVTKALVRMTHPTIAVL